MLPGKDAPDMPAILIELKWNKGADAAISQIKDRRYAGSLKGWSDEVLLVGIRLFIFSVIITGEKEKDNIQLVIEIVFSKILFLL